MYSTLNEYENKFLISNKASVSKELNTQIGELDSIPQLESKERRRESKNKDKSSCSEEDEMERNFSCSKEECKEPNVKMKEKTSNDSLLGQIKITNFEQENKNLDKELWEQNTYIANQIKNWFY